MGATVKIPLDSITISDRPVRVVAVDSEHVEALAVDLAAGRELRAILVRPMGDGYELVDGRHRLEAHRSQDREEIEAEVEEMTDLEALKAAIAGNRLNGRASTAADRRAQITALLEADPGQTDVAIAEQVGVTKMTVGRSRKSLTSQGVTNVTEPTPKPKAKAKAKPHPQVEVEGSADPAVREPRAPESDLTANAIAEYHRAALALAALDPVAVARHDAFPQFSESYNTVLDWSRAIRSRSASPARNGVTPRPKS